MALFQDCVVLFELKGLSVRQKKKIKYMVTDNGGTGTFMANEECSLVVTSDVSSLSPSKLHNIVKHQIPVVGLNYVHCCVEADCRLPVEDFKLDISTANDQPALFKSKKEKWSGNTENAKPSKGQTKPLVAVSVTQSAESPKGRGSVLDNYRVYNETDSDLPEFPENFQVAKYSIFQKNNGFSWCLLELQSAKNERGRKYRVVRYWKDDVQSRELALMDHMVFVSTSEEAAKVFQALADAVIAEGLKQQHLDLPQPFRIGSAPLHELLLEEKLHTGELSPEVGSFVELLWTEALGCIDLILNTPVHKISLNDVTRAEGILLQVQRKIMENKNNACVELLSEYCTLLPQRTPVTADMSSISKQFDLCQLIRDILNVSEMTLGSTVPSSVGKYRALRCIIETVPKGSSEFDMVTCLFQHRKVQVHQILRVNRPLELQSFKSDLEIIRTLLHSSKPHNFVGILSRGLLMPSVAVSQHGIQRTDAGDLGSGIYFSDNINTTLKYSQCSLTDGSRLVLVCEVALGQCIELCEKDPTLTQAPEGYDSVLGVGSVPSFESEFTDDEYVVYSPDQVRLNYVVQLSLEGEELKNFTPEIVQSEEQPLPSPPNQGEGEVEDGIADVKNPLDNVTAGLLNSSGQQIPLQAVHVKCKLVDLLAQVIIFQKYTNESSAPIEAKYVFPLDDSAAVCGFEAFINGKHVVGQVKEKETARREYKQAVEKGHGAYLMDQDAPDVFTISVGNLPPGATVLIKVTFVSELIVKDGSIFFSLPSSVAPWQESAALNQTTQVTVKKVCVTDEEASTRKFNLDMSVEMPHEITEVKCITHQIKMKKTDCKAVLSVLPGELMGPEGFQLLVTLTEVHVPRMWVEKHPDKESQACMLVFYPKFDTASPGTADEVVLLLDASQSMKGESLNTARTIALQILKTLEHNVLVNVIFFGTDHKDAFLYAKPIDEARQEAKSFIKHSSSAGGNTELWRPLRALSLLPPSSGTRNLLLLTDGHIQNTELTLQLLRDNATHTRLFTCGLSATANRHMLRALAQAGGGAYEFFDSKSKHTWSGKVVAQVKRMQAPGANSVSVKWQQFNPTAPPPVQAPKQLHALFNDCHTLVFGFVPHCTKATLLGNLSGQEIETMVSTSELQKTKGTFLHKLTARAIIRDFEDGSLDSNAVLHEEKKAELKSFVIELSKEFSILSQFTSFVAIEERDSEEEKGFTDIPKLIAEEDVDFLPYMSWASEDDSTDVSWNPEDDAIDSESEDETDEESREGKSYLSYKSCAKVMKKTRERGGGGGRMKAAFCEEISSEEDMGFTVFANAMTIEKESWDASDRNMKLQDMEDYELECLDEDLGTDYVKSEEQMAMARQSAPLPKKIFSALTLPMEQATMSLKSLPEPEDIPISDANSSVIWARAPSLLSVESDERFGEGRSPSPPHGQVLFGKSAYKKAKCAFFKPPPETGSTFTPVRLSFLGAEMDVGEMPSIFPAPCPPPVADLDSQRKTASFLQQIQQMPLSLSSPLLPSSPSYVPTSPSVSLPARPQAHSMAAMAEPPGFQFLSQQITPQGFGFGSTVMEECDVLGESETPEILIGSTLSSEKQPESQGLCGVRQGSPSETNISKWQRIFSLQHPEGYWEITPALGMLLNCDISRFADDFLKRKGIVSLGKTAHTDILRLLATLLVLQLMRVEKLREGQLLRTLFCLEDSNFKPERWEAVNKAVEWAQWADRQYPCVYSRLEFGLSWDSSTKQLLGVERIDHCSPLVGLNLNPRPTVIL